MFNFPTGNCLRENFPHLEVPSICVDLGPLSFCHEIRLKNGLIWDLPGGLVVKNLHSNVRRAGSIPCQGTKIQRVLGPHAAMNNDPTATDKLKKKLF